MTTWLQLWERKRAADALANAADAAVMEYVIDGAMIDIEDLTPTHGKRLLFDGFEGMTQHTFSHADALSAASPQASGAFQPEAVCGAACAFIPACDAPCRTCARICERTHTHTRRADPT